MSTRRNSTPAYLPHRQSGRARAVWTDRTGKRQQKLLPGVFDSDESRAAFARLQLEVVTSPLQALPAPGRSVSLNEVLLAFLTHAGRHYRDPDGNLTAEYREYKLVARHVRELYGLAPAVEFGPLALKAVYQFLKAIGAGDRCGWMVSGNDITRAPGLASKKLKRVVEKLPFRWQRLVTSQRGSGGGYCLTLPPRSCP